MSTPSHEDIESLLGAYALDAVEPDEAEAVRSHLGECPRCRAEVAQHRETATLLANLGGEAPDGVWDHIASEISADIRWVPRLRSPRSRAWIARTGAGLALAAAVLIAVLGIQVRHLDQRVNDLQRPLAASGVDQAALAAVASPGARLVSLRSDRTAALARAVLLPSGQAFILDAVLPSLPASQTYQLWAVSAGTAVSLGLLGPAPTTVAFRVDSSSVTTLAITAEPAGGVVSTHQSPIVSGAVPA